jgi:hypothetical protein
MDQIDDYGDDYVADGDDGGGYGCGSKSSIVSTNTDDDGGGLVGSDDYSFEYGDGYGNGPDGDDGSGHSCGDHDYNFEYWVAT